MKKPNLFIVGAPKCGTTSLYDYLRQHPDVFMCPVKEPGYFCADFHKEADRFHKTENYLKTLHTEEDYLRLFSRAKDEKVLGEATPVYLYSREAPKLIKRFNPDAKIIIMLREPASFLYSWHAQLLAVGEEDERDFERALELERARVKDISLVPRTAWFPFRTQYTEHPRFSKYLRNYLKQFDRKNILVILLDDLKSDPERTYRRVLSFLGIDVSFRPDFGIKNPRTIPRSLALMRVLKHPPPPLRSLIRRFFTLEQRKKLSLFIGSLLQRKDSGKIDARLKRDLQRKFLNEVKELDALLHRHGFLPRGRSLIKIWGYEKI